MRDSEGPVKPQGDEDRGEKEEKRNEMEGEMVMSTWRGETRQTKTESAVEGRRLGNSEPAGEKENGKERGPSILKREPAAFPALCAVRELQPRTSEAHPLSCSGAVPHVWTAQHRAHPDSHIPLDADSSFKAT